MIFSDIQGSTLAPHIDTNLSIAPAALGALLYFLFAAQDGDTGGSGYGYGYETQDYGYGDSYAHSRQVRSQVRMTVVCIKIPPPKYTKNVQNIQNCNISLLLGRQFF